MWPYSLRATRPDADLDHRAHQLDAGDRRSLAALPELPARADIINYIDFGSTGGTGEAAFDAIKLFKTNPTGTIYTPPTSAITTTGQ